MSNRYHLPLRGLAGLCLALLTATALLAPLPARAQGGPPNILWQRQLGTAAELIQSEAQMIRCRGGGYAIAATIIDTTVAYWEYAALVTRLDEQGHLLWQRRIRPGGAYYLAENRAGQLLIARSGSRYPPDTFPHLTLLDAGGQVLWDYAQFPYVKRLRAGHDGTFVGIARDRYADTTRLFKMDSVGADVWRRTLPPAAGCVVGYLLDVQPTRRGYYRVLQESQTAANARLWELIRVDEQGQELNRQSLPTGPISIIKSAVGADSALLYAYGPCSRLTPQGVPLWTRAYSNVEIRAVCGQADGGMVLAAINHASPTLDTDLGLLKVAADGTVLKDSAFFRPFSYEEPRDIFLDDQDNYVLCMASTRGTHGGPVLVIFKVRAWATPLGLAAEGVALAESLTISPNPATDVVRLRGRVPAATATLRDALGRVVRTYLLDAAAGDAPLSLAGLLPGCYLLSVTAESGVAARTWRVLKQ